MRRKLLIPILVVVIALPFSAWLIHKAGSRTSPDESAASVPLPDAAPALDPAEGAAPADASAAREGAASLEAAQLPPGWRRDESGLLIHTDSGLEFPLQWNGMTRVDPTTFDETGRDVAIGYESTQKHLSLTFYVYPSDLSEGPDPEQHFKEAVQAILQLHGNAVLDQAVPMELPLGDQRANGYLAFLHWAENNQDLGSFLAILSQGQRYLKLRVTFALSGEAAPIQHALDTSYEFLKSLAVPPQ